MSDDTKICPFCGEEIKACAIKCKHCKSLLEEESAQQLETPSGALSVSKNNTSDTANAILGWIIAFVIICFMIGCFDSGSEQSSSNPLPIGTSETSEVISSDNSSELNITGTYSGFGGFTEFAYTFDGDEDCAAKAVGKSLVKGIIADIEESSPKINSTMYSISRYNPNLKFEVRNPTPVHDIYVSYCKADLIFKNYKPDTIAGYTGYGENAVPYTLDNAHFTVNYTTSKLGDKYKVNVGRIQGYSLEGYEE